jgi:hypothetical protein
MIDISALTDGAVVAAAITCILATCILASGWPLVLAGPVATLYEETLSLVRRPRVGTVELERMLLPAAEPMADKAAAADGPRPVADDCEEKQGNAQCLSLVQDQDQDQDPTTQLEQSEAPSHSTQDERDDDEVAAATEAGTDVPDGKHVIPANAGLFAWLQSLLPATPTDAPLQSTACLDLHDGANHANVDTPARKTLEAARQALLSDDNADDTARPSGGSSPPWERNHPRTIAAAADTGSGSDVAVDSVAFSNGGSDAGDDALDCGSCSEAPGEEGLLAAIVDDAHPPPAPDELICHTIPWIRTADAPDGDESANEQYGHEDGAEDGSDSADADASEQHDQKPSAVVTGVDISDDEDLVLVHHDAAAVATAADQDQEQEKNPDDACPPSPYEDSREGSGGDEENVAPSKSGMKPEAQRAMNSPDPTANHAEVQLAKVLATCSIRQNPTNDSPKIGEYKAGQVLRMHNTKRTADGYTMSCVDTWPRCQSSGWVKHRTSRGKKLLELQGFRPVRN